MSDAVVAAVLRKSWAEKLKPTSAVILSNTLDIDAGFKLPRGDGNTNGWPSILLVSALANNLSVALVIGNR